MTEGVSRKSPRAVIWLILAALAAAAVLIIVFRNLDFERLVSVLIKAEPIWLVALAASIPLEQLIRSWKWRQILFDIRPVGTFRLFSAVMVGYFANMLIPIGLSPLVRAWLIAGLEGLKVSTVLVTTGIERFVDGFVFAILVGILVLFAALPETEGNLRLGLTTAGGGSLLLFAGLLGGLFVIKRHYLVAESIVSRFVAWLEQAFGGRLEGIGHGLVEGIIWPKSQWRGTGIILASVSMKTISTTHFLWAGLIFGILLPPFDYLFIMVFTGFALIVSRFIRIPGGGIIGSAFALKLLEIPDEEALTMVFAVHSAAIIMIAGIGTIAMWKSGLTVFKLRRAAREPLAQSDNINS